MPTISVKVQGFQEAVAKMKKMGNLKAIPGVRDALFAGAVELSHEAESRAPKGPTGNLKRAMRAFRAKVLVGKPLAAFMVAVRKIAPHLHLVAFGTKRKVAGTAKGDPTGKKALFSSARGFGPFKKARGSKANSFFADAIRARRASVRNRIAQEMKRAIEEAARK